MLKTLFIIFMTLKLCGLLDWQWIWIFSPFIGSVLISALKDILNLKVGGIK